MTDFNQATRIVSKFGDGDFNAGKAVLVQHGFKETSIRSWRHTGWVPQPEHQRVLDVAGALKVDVTPYDFIVHLRAN